MSNLFTSDRERRLWFLAGALVLTIYSTLVLTAKFVGYVDEKVLGVAFFACLILVAISILTQGLKSRPGGLEAGIVAGVCAVYLLLGIRMSIPERSHLMEYGVLSVVIYEAFSERTNHGRPVRYPSVWAAGVTSLVGIVDEVIQAALPSRVFDVRDIVFNVLAAVVAAAGMAALRAARR